jgi:hypothetical protein
MNCPHCQQPIPDDLVRSEGARLNGQAGRGKAKARTSEQARKAAMAGVLKRWEKMKEKSKSRLATVQLPS